MIRYANAARFPAEFSRLFGRTVDDFEALYAAFAQAHEERLARSTVTRRSASPRLRRPGAGRRYKNTLRDRLLMAVFRQRANPTLELLGLFFDIDKTSAEDNLKDILTTLNTMASFALEPAESRQPKLHTLSEAVAAFPEIAAMLEVVQESHGADNPSSSSHQGNARKAPRHSKPETIPRSPPGQSATPVLRASLLPHRNIVPQA